MRAVIAGVQLTLSGGLSLADCPYLLGAGVFSKAYQICPLNFADLVAQLDSMRRMKDESLNDHALAPAEKTSCQSHGRCDSLGCRACRFQLHRKSSATHGHSSIGSSVRFARSVR